MYIKYLPNLSVYSQPQPKCTRPPPTHRAIQMRTSNHCAKSALAEDLRTTNWTPLYHLPPQQQFQYIQDAMSGLIDTYLTHLPPQQQFQYFQDAMAGLIDTHLAIVTVKAPDSSDKP